MNNTVKVSTAEAIKLVNNGTDIFWETSDGYAKVKKCSKTEFKMTVYNEIENKKHSLNGKMPQLIKLLNDKNIANEIYIIENEIKNI
ncbi:hypothetical protein [Bacillus toyonensis]|uniref:hypothetical protein n=1 Tax=Bacillus toyonensis TaxID=155322 RepID=UPI002E23A7FD|nr:hypothetical protein [Bacillus toyonensis]